MITIEKKSLELKKKKEDLLAASEVINRLVEENKKRRKAGVEIPLVDALLLENTLLKWENMSRDLERETDKNYDDLRMKADALFGDIIDANVPEIEEGINFLMTLKEARING